MSTPTPGHPERSRGSMSSPGTGETADASTSTVHTSGATRKKSLSTAHISGATRSQSQSTTASQHSVTSADVGDSCFIDTTTSFLPPASHNEGNRGNDGEQSPLLQSNHVSLGSSTSPIPDLLEALNVENEAQNTSDHAMTTASPTGGRVGVESMDNSDESSSSTESGYHSPTEGQMSSDEFPQSTLQHQVASHATTPTSSSHSVASSPQQLTASANRGLADQIDHPLSVSHLPVASEALEDGLQQSEPYMHTSVSQESPMLLSNFSHLPSSATTIANDSAALGLSMTHPSIDTTYAQQQQQQHRRRPTPSRRRGTPSISSTTTTTTTASSGSLRRPRSSNIANSSSSGSNHESSAGAATTGLRASLDAGMAAVRRWIRSRTASSSTSVSTAATTSTAAQLPPNRSSSRSIVWHSDSATDQQSSASFSVTSFGEEDLFAARTMGDEPRLGGQHYHPTIFEEGPEQEEEELGHRQRSLSEPDSLQIRDIVFQRAVTASSSQPRSMRRRRSRLRGRTSRGEVRTRGGGSTHLPSTSHQLISSGQRQLSSSAAAVLFAHGGRGIEQPVDLMSSSSTLPAVIGTSARTTTDAASAVDGSMTVPVAGDASLINSSTESTQASTIERERRARIRWIRINRRFQLVITLVALLFSLLLFSILICWVVLTSAYVVSFDRSCDVPLKTYYWLVTLQLVMDVFRSDIMRCIFSWDANSGQRMPCRVVVYNVAYLIYALLVLRMGIRSVFVNEGTECRVTAPDLFNTSLAFVTLSLAAWTTIVCGYLLPFCIVAALLTHNGYNPSATMHPNENGTGPPQPVFPAAYSTTGAPPGCVERLPVIRLSEFPEDYPRECCICMEDFDQDDTIVETCCKHVFHKQCCRQWLRQARTCPVCRTDIPAMHGVEAEDNGAGRSSSPISERIPIGPTGRPVQGLIRILQQRAESGGLHSRGAQRQSRTSISRANVGA